MGWFLTGRSSDKPRRGGTKRGSRASAAIGPKPWDPQRTLLAVRLCAYVAVAVGVVVGWVYLEENLTRYASARHTTTITPRVVSLDDKPQWMSPAVEHELVEVVGRHVVGDPLDVQSLRDAVAALEAQPWVKRVSQVRRGADGLIHVEAEYRRPMAVLHTAHGYVLVDRDGVRLPGLYERHQIPLLGLVQVTGVSSREPRIGDAWRGDDLAAALALASLLEEQPFARQIEAVDVSGRDARGRLELVLHAGRNRIIWGLPLGHPQPIQIDDQTKLDRLRRLAEAPGGLTTGTTTARLNAPGGIAFERTSLEHAEARHGH